MGIQPLSRRLLYLIVHFQETKRTGRPPLQITTKPDIWIARVIGIIAIASGFILGIEGLNQPGSIWLSTALGLIVTGLCAQGYAFYRTITQKIQPADKKDV